MRAPPPWMPRLSPAGQAAVVTGPTGFPATPQERTTLLACANDPAIQNTQNCAPSMTFLGAHCTQNADGSWSCRGVNGESYTLPEFLAAYYGGPIQGSVPQSTYPAPTPPTASIPASLGLSPAPPAAPATATTGAVEVLALKAQLHQQDQTIRGLQITLAAVIVAGPVLTLLVEHWRNGRRRR